MEDSLNQAFTISYVLCHICFRQFFAPKGASLDMKGVVWLDLPLVTLLGSQKLSASTVSNRACLVVSLAPAWSWLLGHMAHIAIQMPKTQCALRPNKHLYFALSMIKKSKSNKMEAPGFDGFRSPPPKTNSGNFTWKFSAPGNSEIPIGNHHD